MGCAIIRKFAMSGVPSLLVEKGRDILSGASKANSAIFHTAYDAGFGTLELQCMQNSRQEYLSIMEELNLPLLRTGAVVVIDSSEQFEQLHEIQASAQQKGITEVEILDRKGMEKYVPWVDTRFCGGLLIPGEDVMDPWSAPLAYARHAVANGAEVLCSCEVQDGSLNNGVWQLQTNLGEIRAETIVNASGLHGDSIEQIRGQPDFEIRPRKGQFVVFDKSASSVVNRIILQVPTPQTKGITITPSIFGNVIVGPTAEEQKSREDTSVNQETLQKLIDFAHQVVPALRHHDTTATYAGIRPATNDPDYCIESYPADNWISVAGIRSSGLTSALGIAQYVTGLYDKDFTSLKKLDRLNPVSVPNLAEHRTRPYQHGGFGEVVCHCERVTRQEIENAVSGPVPARDIGGLKRRTRCLMGRCQGFYCSWRIWQMTADKIHWPNHLQPSADNARI